MITTIAALYVSGWIMFVFVTKPEDATEGLIQIVSGIAWPLFAIGWLVSRPFDR